MKTAQPSLVGRPIDGLTLAERMDHKGHWVAIELYSPATLPMRRIEAEALNPKECAAELSARGLSPEKFEYWLITPPYR